MSAQAGQSQEQKSGQQQLRTGQPQGSFQDNKTENRLNMELGAIYFLELCNYEKSREYFSNAEGNALAEYMTVVAEYFAESIWTEDAVSEESVRTEDAVNRERESVQAEAAQERDTRAEAVQKKNIRTESTQEKDAREERLRQALEAAKAETEAQDEESIGEKLCFYQCILKGYTVLNKNADFRNVIKLGKLCLEEDSAGKVSEILGYMAQAYEGLGKDGKAVKMYEEQLKYEEDEEVREEIARKIMRN